METSALTFAEPRWFLALLALPVVAGLYFWSQRRNAALITRVVAPRLRAQLAGAVSPGRRLFKSFLVLAVFALVAAALARPQMGFMQREVKQRGRDIIIALDTSRSMLATDVSPTRLARAKLVAQDLLRLVKGDRVGLVAFAGSAFLQAPLTLDQSAVLATLDELDTEVIPRGGSNIAEAISVAESAFGKGEGKTRALVILTDGEELDADGIAAAKRAAGQGIRIFTVGIGSAEGSPIPIRRSDGGTDFVRDASGKTVQSRLDATRLNEIAGATGGFYLPLDPEVARTIFQEGILPMEESETGTLSSRQPIERYQWPLGAAVALLAFWLLLGDRRRTPSLRRVAAAAFAFAALPATGFAASGYDEYAAGNYDKALADFQRGLDRSPHSDKLQFDAGAASYKLGNFPQAVDHFTKALLSSNDALRGDASYNLANALVRRGEGAPDKEKKKSDWKNAIDHYTEALNTNPKNSRAEENREIVKKLLEDLEKEEQQQQQDEDKKDQQKDDQKKDDQENKDQKDKGEEDKKDQDQKDQQDKNQQDQAKNDQKKDQGQDQKKDEREDQGGDSNDQKKDDQQKSDQARNDKKDESKDPKDQKDQGGKEPKPDEPQDSQGGQGGRDEQKPQDPQGRQPQPSPTPGEKKEGDLKADPGQPDESEPEEGEGQALAQAEEKDGEMSEAQAANLLNSLRSEEQRVRLMQRQQTDPTLRDW